MMMDNLVSHSKSSYPNGAYNLPNRPRISHKKDPYIDTQKERVQVMLQQVNGMLSHLLKDLQYLYIANGINFYINHFHNALIRLLTPFQLLSHFQIADNSDLFNYAHFNSRKQTISNQKTIETSCKKQNLCFTPTGFEGSLQKYDRQGQGSTKGKQQKKKRSKHYFYRKWRTKPILDSEIECNLVQWALNKLSQNKRVRRKDLAQKAIKLSGNQQGFIGSIGWVNRFLNRHPRLKDELMKVARANIGIRHPYIDYSQQQQQQIQRLQAENKEELKQITGNSESNIEKNQECWSDSENSKEDSELTIKRKNSVKQKTQNQQLKLVQNLRNKLAKEQIEPNSSSENQFNQIKPNLTYNNQNQSQIQQLGFQDHFKSRKLKKLI